MHPVVMSIPAVAGRVPESADHVARHAANAGLDEPACFQVRVAFTEVLNNIIDHALPAGQGATIDIRCQAISGEFQLTVVDRGKPIAIPETHEFPDPRVEGGRGWPIIFNWMDSVEYLAASGCNIMTLRKYLP